MLQINEGLIQGLLSEDETDSCDSEWKFEDGNVFNVIVQELRFVNITDFLHEPRNYLPAKVSHNKVVIAHLLP